jgi:hypothetical protein
MSRSKKKPYISTTCIGDRAGVMKDWKKSANKKLRKVPVDRDVLPDKREVDKWSAPNDGKHYWDDNKATRK